MQTDEGAKPVARLNLHIDPQLDLELRLACLKRTPRLSLRDAVEEALRLWLSEERG